MSSRATVRFLLLVQSSPTRRSDHAVLPMLKSRETARHTSSCVKLSVQRYIEVFCCERIPPPRLGETLSHHNPKSILATQALHDRFQSYSMKPGQNPLIALIALEEMASQLSQPNFSMAPRSVFDPILLNPTRLRVQS